MIRHLHPSPEWVQAADQAYALLDNFISQLNTHQGLYEVKFPRSFNDCKPFASFQALRREMASAQFKQRSREEQHVAQLFLKDFIKSGIEMPPSVRSTFVLLSDRINANGHSFSTRIDASIQQRVHWLEQMINDRVKLAQCLGYESFAHLYLQDKMAKTPGRVLRFLETANHHNRLSLMEEEPRNGVETEIPTGSRRLQLPVTIGTAMESISDLFYNLYGLRLVPGETQEGEVWHSDVRKLEVKEESGDTVGVIYCDLYTRPGSNDACVPKCKQPVQFTVRCSRRIDDDPVDAFPHEHYTDLSYIGIETRDGSRRHQLPIAVLSCSFSPPNGQHVPTLSVEEVSTLYHEMGHAIHAMLARTSFHHVAGTRCKIDFVESPSILMEYLCDAIHITPKAASRSKEELRERQIQIFFSMMDQTYHSRDALAPGFTTYKALSSLYKEYHYHSYPNGSSPQVHFTHLYTYGGGYYAYLWSRTLAEQIYKNLLMKPLSTFIQQREPGRPRSMHFSEIEREGLRRAGEELANNVLKCGGAVDPWEMNWDTILGRPIQDLFP